jgi:hypothetical protein
MLSSLRQKKVLKRGSEMFKHYLMHEKLFVRFGALLGVVAAVVLSAWTLSYLFLPEGVLLGRNAAQVLAGNDLAGGSVWLEWLRILAINLGVVFLLVVAPNVLRTESDYPLGYSTVTLLALVFGVTLGTNSFTLSLGGKLPPTVAIFGSSGFYEISAYVLAVTATASIARYRLVGKWPKQTIEAVVPLQAKSVIRERYAGILLAITILLIATGWEAYRFSLAVAL